MHTSLRILSILLAGAAPSACDAATPKKAVPAKAVAKPAPPPRPVQPVGLFRLDRAPEQGSLARGIVPPGTVRLVMNGQNIDLAPDGRFLIGFGRDFDATAIIVAYKSDGTNVSERLPVAKRAWHVENLKTVQRYSQPDAEFQARRPGELDQINAARRMAIQSDGWRQKMIWPAKGRISGFFGSQRIYAGEPGSPHSGVDIARPTGTPVVAPADGVVILAAQEPFTLEGRLLMIDHGMGLNSAFLHLSRIDVAEGQVVTRGQVVGAIGTTGRSTGAHLHWGMKLGDVRIDPQLLVGPMPTQP